MTRRARALPLTLTWHQAAPALSPPPPGAVQEQNSRGGRSPGLPLQRTEGLHTPSDLDSIVFRDRGHGDSCG